MNNYFYINENKEQNIINNNNNNNNNSNNNNNNINNNEETIQQNNDKFDKDLKKLNDKAFNWTFNDSRRSLGVGIYGNLIEEHFNQSSRYPIDNNQSLQHTSNDRINDHIFNNHQEQSRNNFFEIETELRDLKFNNYKKMKQNIPQKKQQKKKNKEQEKIKYNSQDPFAIFEKKSEKFQNPRQNKHQNYPNPHISYDNTIDAENNIFYNKIKKKAENTSNTSYVNSKKNNLLRPRPNIVSSVNNTNFLNNQYMKRMSSIDSKNPNNRI